MGHFKEYLPYQYFLMRMDNNPLTYIMSIPNLDAMSHQWVGGLAWFNFELEYQKACDNMMADVLSWVTTQLDPDTLKSILDRVTLGTTQWMEAHDPAIVEGNHCLEQEISVTAGCTYVQMHVTDWADSQREHLMFSAVLDWLKAQKKIDLKALLAEHTSSEEGRLILRNWQNFMIHHGALYLCSTPIDLLLFIVPRAHGVTALNGCHQDAGHQEHDCTLSLLWECFWWPGMTTQMWQSIKSSMQCLQHEGDLSKPLYTQLWPPLHWTSCV